MHLNFALTWWDSFICDCICQKNMIKNQRETTFLHSKLCHFIAPLFAHFVHFLPFLPFVRVLRFANRASGIAHFFCLSCPRYFCFSCPRYFCLSCLAIFAFHARAIFALSALYRFVVEGETISPLSKPFTS